MKMLIIEQKKKEKQTCSPNNASRHLGRCAFGLSVHYCRQQQWLAGAVVVVDVAGHGSGICKWHHFPVWVCKHDQMVHVRLQGIYTCTFHALFLPGLAPVFIILVTILLCIINIGRHTPHVNRPVVTDYNQFSSVLYKFSISKTATDYK
jgi:hypothetical protein